jgi:hypothetical protein
MKILEPGRAQKGWSTEATCSGNGNGGGGCGAKLFVEQDDIYITTSSCRDETEDHYTFRCVTCGVETDLPRKTQPPTNISMLLPTKRVWMARHPEAVRST